MFQNILLNLREKDKMKRIIVMRHAKAEKDNNKADFERNLTEKGIKASLFIGKILKDNNLIPDFVLCSDAYRTKQTAENVLNKISFYGEIKYRKDFYLGNAENIVEQLKTFNEKNKTIMIIGHNPTMEILCELLDKRKGEYTLRTANLVVFIPIISKWKELKPASCKQEYFIDHRSNL